METGKLKVMGDIVLVEEDETHTVKLALVIEFDSTESIRQAITDGECKFSFGE